MRCQHDHDMDDCPCVAEESDYWLTRRTIVFLAVFGLLVLAVVMGGWRFA